MKGSLHGGSSGVSSPSIVHPTANKKFVMDKYIKAKNKLKRYLSADFSIIFSLISEND